MTKLSQAKIALESLKEDLRSVDYAKEPESIISIIGGRGGSATIQTVSNTLESITISRRQIPMLIDALKQFGNKGR